MSDFLETSINALPIGYQRALEELASRRSLIKDVDIGALLLEIAAGLDKETFTTTLDRIKFVAGLPIRKEELLRKLMQIQLDLTALYAQNSKLDSFGSRFYEVTNSSENSIRQSLIKLNEIMLSVLARQQNPDFNEIKLLYGKSATNTFNCPNPANVDNESGSITAGISSVRQYATERGPFAPKVYVTMLSPGISGNSMRSFDPEKALDPDPRHYWMDIILNDSRITSEYQQVEYNGPIVQYTFRFRQQEKVNQVRIDSFSRFPMKLLDIVVGSSEEVKSVSNFEITDLPTGITQFDFELVSATELRLILLQENYRELDVFVPRTLFRQHEFLDMLFKRSFEEEIGNYQTDFNRVNEARSRLEQALDLVVPDDPIKTTTNLLSLATDDPRLLVEAGKLVGEVTDLPDEYIELKKFEYTFGIQRLEINKVQYSNYSFYSSDKLLPNGSPMEISLEVDEDFVEVNTDSTTKSHRESEIQYELEISPKRTIPILPEGTTEVLSERLTFNQTNLRAQLRFPASSGDLYRNGYLVDPLEYTLGGDTVQLVAGTFVPNALYTFHYVLSTTFTHVNLLSTFDSIKADVPITFSGTDSKRMIELPSYPYILLDIMGDPAKWVRRDSRDAMWEYVPGTSDDQVLFIDGEYFGAFASTLGTQLNSAAGPGDPIDLDADPLPTGIVGVININNETISYIKTAPATYQIVSRGLNGTRIDTHLVSSVVTWQASRTYEPITVMVNGIRAGNLTDYSGGLNQAFQTQLTATDYHEYVVIGRRVYFDRKVNGKIAVSFRRMVDYLKLNARFNQNSRDEFYYSGRLNLAYLKLRTALC